MWSFSSLFGFGWPAPRPVPVPGYWPGVVLPPSVFVGPPLPGAVLRWGVVMGCGSVNWVPGLCVGCGPFDWLADDQDTAIAGAVDAWDMGDSFCGEAPVVVPVWSFAGGFVFVAGEPFSVAPPAGALS